MNQPNDIEARVKNWPIAYRTQDTRWICLLCKSTRPGEHRMLDDRKTPCPVLSPRSK